MLDLRSCNVVKVQTSTCIIPITFCKVISAPFQMILSMDFSLVHPVMRTSLIILSLQSPHAQISAKLNTFVIHSLRESEFCLHLVHSSMIGRILLAFGLKSSSNGQ